MKMILTMLTSCNRYKEIKTSVEQTTSNVLQGGMKDDLVFKILGDPIPLARPRFGRGGKIFTPAHCQNAKRRIALEALCSMKGHRKFHGPLDVEIHFELKMPKKPKDYQAQGKPHISTPDLSNLIKLVEDALNDVVWYDDALISKILSTKFYGANPSTTVVVRSLEV